MAGEESNCYAQFIVISPVSKTCFFFLFSLFNLTNMKKYFILSGAAIAAIIFSNCNPSKKSTSGGNDVKEEVKVPATTYANGVSAVIMNNCAPCHIPSKGGKKKAYDNFANVKADIDEIIRRIELDPSVRGFMPFKGTAKMSDSTIAIFKKWKADGLAEN